MEAGKLYHIYNRGINRGNIFFEEDNYYFFLRQFQKHMADYLDVFSYCLMPNHFHLFVRVKETVSMEKISNLNAVEKAFRNFFISYAKSINKRFDRTGALFQYKFKRKEIESDSYITWLVYYIHRNPVNGKLCNNLNGWKFSSYNAFLVDKPTLIAKVEVIKWFGGLEQFVEFHQKNLEADKKYEIFQSLHNPD
jgi:putative transposase